MNTQDNRNALRGLTATDIFLVVAPNKHLQRFTILDSNYNYLLVADYDNNLSKAYYSKITKIMEVA